MATSVTYTPVTGVFQARVIYKGDKPDDRISTVEIQNPATESFIRVKQDCRDFIMEGKTEKITFDGKTWNVQRGYEVRRFIDNVLYEFFVKETV